MPVAASAGPHSTHVDVPATSDETISRLLRRRAREAADATYCTFRGQAISLAELDRQVDRIAGLLHAHGLRKGDRVAVMLPSHPEHLFVIFALARLGLVRVPVNVHLVGAPLQHVFAHLRPRALLADLAYRPALGELPRDLDLVLWRGTPGEGFDAYTGMPAMAPAESVAADDIVTLTPSSGTTGAPKGVLKSDRHLRGGPDAILRLTGAGPADTFLFWEALHHGAGVAVAIAALKGGFRLAMLERFSASRFWDQAREHGATHVHYLGSVLPMLLKQPAREDDRDHPVRVAWGGGCPAALWCPFAERFGVQIREGYGLSELLTFVTLNLDGPAGSIGKPLAHYELRLVDDAGQPVPDGTPGEIQIRTRIPELGFLGYFEAPQATADALRDGWFLTGDLATRDADGYLYYAGRKKEMLRRRGINISPFEVESVIARHEAVEEVAVVGVPSELGEDELKLFVRRCAGASLAPEELARWCIGQLPYFQVPRYIAFIDEFPKTPTQRIQKKALSRSVAGVWDLEAAGLARKPPR